MTYPVPARPVTRNRGFAQRRIRSAPVELYTRTVTVPISGAQATGKVPASGTLSLEVGPAGLGTVWFPAAAVISTSVGVADPATCSVYVGAISDPTALQGTLPYQGGAGVISLAVPQITPGMYVLAVWTGATVGSLATLNVTGTAQMLTR